MYHFPVGEGGGEVKVHCTISVAVSASGCLPEVNWAVNNSSTSSVIACVCDWGVLAPTVSRDDVLTGDSIFVSTILLFIYSV